MAPPRPKIYHTLHFDRLAAVIADGGLPRSDAALPERAARPVDYALSEVHKLMYFMHEAGEPLRLRYLQAPSGPYAENLSHLLGVSAWAAWKKQFTPRQIGLAAEVLSRLRWL
jgi:hypothetical protein